jgi:hypothetical protein
MSEWENIQGMDGWRMKLSELLKEAEGAAQHGDLAARLALSSRLTEFIVHSSPNTPEILALDGIADQARAGLLRLTIEERLAEISARTADLARLTKEFQTQAAVAEASAAAIRLERTRRVVGVLTESVQVLNELRSVLETNTDAELTTRIGRLIVSIQTLRTQIERPA